MSRYPFAAAPLGWFAVAYSSEVAPGAVVPVRAFGRELVVCRGEDGAARAYDAHCPHLGAHLGHGGRVEGNVLRCPFHGWCFDAAGACVAIPYPVKIPPRAQLEPWPAREVGGFIFVYYHPDRQPPSWELPEIPESSSPDYTPAPQPYVWRFKSHVQELAENVVDPAHFLSVHRTESMPVTEVDSDGVVLKSRSRMLERTPRGVTEVRLDSVMHGLGLIRLDFAGIVHTIALACNTPLDEESVVLRFRFFTENRGGAGPEHGVGAALIADIVKQTEADIPIWEHKIYRERGAFCAADEALMKLRRWAKGFYPAA